MVFRFFPKAFNFFDLFEKQVGHAVEAACFFKEVVARGGVSEEALSKMAAIEHQGDDVAHTIIDQLNKTFITPFDREDIYALAKQLDDIIDMVNTILSRLKVYNITGVDKNLVEFSVVIEQSVRAVARAVGGLRNIKNSPGRLRCLHRGQPPGERRRRDAGSVLSELLPTPRTRSPSSSGRTSIMDAETVLDVCEDVAHVVDSIMVKQA